MMEIKSLTGIRGIAALYVVIFHLVERNFGGHLDDFLTNGYLSVDFFFILSGFIMSMVHNEFSTNGGGNYSHFMFKRFVRIYPVYFFLLIVTLLIVKIASGNTENPVLFLINALLLQSLLGFNYISSSWSISTELFAYLIFPALLLFISKTKNITPIVILALASLCYISVNNTILEFSVNVSSGWKSILRCLADYSLGVTSYVLFKNGIVINRLTSYVLTAILVYFLMHRHVDVYIIILCAIIIPSLIDSKNFVSKVLSIKPVHYLGQISYSLYLVHSILLNQLHFVFDKISYGEKTCIFASSIIVSILTFHFVEKPCRNWLTRYAVLFNNKA
jgi:peptidoglycan/LPS O-acetylase OafA/YrhL